MTIKIAGCDLGKSSASFVIASINGDGSIDWRGDSSFSSDGIKHDDKCCPCF